MKLRLTHIIEVVLLTIVFFLVNIRSFIFWNLYPETGSLAREAWREIFIWLMALFVMFYLLEKHNLLRRYLLAWQKEPILIVFVFFSLASALWSNMWTVTLHRSLVFTFATMTAVFLGLRYSLSGFLQALYWFGAVIVAVSFLLVFISPALGTDLSPVYDGAWRGVFWHKNQLGNILPILNLVFLIRFFSLKNNGAFIEKTLAIALYIFSLIEIVFAKSASGYILFILLHFIFGSAFLWLKIRHLLRPLHYYVILAITLVGAAGILLNLEFVLGLFNRTTAFTGRVPMWMILLRDVFPQNRWFGQGFGTVWADLVFRLYMRDVAGWPYPIMIGDNGFLDVLLNLGIVGLLLFLFNYIKVWGISARYSLRELSLEGFFPIIFMIYTLFANITYSLFLETEVFVWLLIVTLMVILTQKRNEIYND